MPSEWQITLPLQQEVQSAEAITGEDIVEKVLGAANTAYTTKVAEVGAANFTQFERVVLLQSIDTHWREHLSALDYLRQGIHLRGYAQKQPKQEYKREAFELFRQLLDAVKNDVTKVLMTVKVQSGAQLEQAAEDLENRAENIANVTYTAPTETGEVETHGGRNHRAGRSTLRPRGPQRPVPLRQRQEVQAVPRQAGLSRRATTTTTGFGPFCFCVTRFSDNHCSF